MTRTLALSLVVSVALCAAGICLAAAPGASLAVVVPISIDDDLFILVKANSAPSVA